MAINFRKTRPEEPEINLIPFIDVLLVVLIFLMLSTTYSKFTELQVTLPIADAERSRDRPKEIVVGVAADGRYVINRKPLEGRSVEQLAGDLAAAAGGDAEKVVIISADAAAAHQSVINVLDAARRAGLVRLTFATQTSAGGEAPLSRTVADAAPAGWAARVQAAWLARSGLALALLPLAWLYGALVALNRARFRLRLARVEWLPVPVIVVGNLVAGGAGKTPTVIALVQRLAALGHRPGIVSRGHGRDSDAVLEVTAQTAVQRAGDEPLLLQRRTGVPVVVGRDRVTAGRELLRRHPDVDVIVSDDGLQHHRLARDLQLLVFDERGIGNGWLLPAGLLREPLPAQPPGASLVIYNAASASTPWPGFIVQRRLVGVLPLDAWWHEPDTQAQPLASLRGRALVAVAGLARPGRFFEMLRAHGLVVDTRVLPDHDAYTTLPWPAGTPDVIVTEKDAVKLEPARVAPTRVWVAALDLSFDPSLCAALDAALARLLTRTRA